MGAITKKDTISFHGYQLCNKRICTLSNALKKSKYPFYFTCVKPLMRKCRYVLFKWNLYFDLNFCINAAINYLSHYILGDRYSRRNIMAFGVFLWAIFTLIGSFMSGSPENQVCCLFHLFLSITVYFSDFDYSPRCFPVILL